MSKVGKKRRWMNANFNYLDEFDPPNRIVGFDLSLRSTGCVTYYRSQSQINETHLIESTNEEIMRDSVKKMGAAYKEVVQDFKPDVIAYESITAGGNFRSIKQLSMTYALMLEAALSLDYDPLLISFAPPQLKKAACGDHQADKNQMLLGVYKRWEEDFEEDDVADAFVSARLTEEVFNLKTNYLTQRKNHVEDGEMDLDKFLLEYDKGRVKHGRDSEEVFEVAKAVMKSKDFLKDQNNYERYQAAKEDIDKVF